MNLIDWEPKVLFSNRAKQLLYRFDFLQINKRIEMSIFYVTKIYPTLPFFNTVYIFAFDRAVQYFDVTNKSSSFTVECVPEELEKKTTLLLYFARYMDEHLIQVSAMFFLKKWNEFSVSFQEQTLKCTCTDGNSISLTFQGGRVELSKDSDDSWYGNVYLKKWFRTSKAIVLYLSDGTLQVQRRFI